MDKVRKFALKDVLIDGRSLGAAVVPLFKERSGRLTFHIGAIFPDGNPDSHDDLLKSKIELVGPDGRRFEVLASKLAHSFHGDQNSVIVVPKRRPISLIYAKQFTSGSAIIASPPEMIIKNIDLTECSGNCFSVQFDKDSGGTFLRIRTDHPGDSERLLEHYLEFHEFISFAKGQFCGLGNIEAYDATNGLAAEIIGFTRYDENKVQTTWFDEGIQEHLPEIFLKFSFARRSDLHRRALRQTLEFYRASNASRDISIEMSVIAAHSALEAIVNYILEHEAGWSRALLSERANIFSDKARAAFKFMRLTNDLMEHSAELKLLSKSRQNMDGFQIISFFRNKIVHQDLNFSPNGVQLHKCWLLIQWLVEALTLTSIGYYGKIVDRRIYQGWRGSTCLLG